MKNLSNISESWSNVNPGKWTSSAHQGIQYCSLISVAPATLGPQRHAEIDFSSFTSFDYIPKELWPTLAFFLIQGNS